MSIGRIIWFILVGWWLGLFWFVGSVLLIVTIVFAPFGIYTITKTWKVMTLKESPTTILKEHPTTIIINIKNEEK